MWRQGGVNPHLRYHWYQTPTEICCTLKTGLKTWAQGQVHGLEGWQPVPAMGDLFPRLWTRVPPFSSPSILCFQLFRDLITMLHHCQSLFPNSSDRRQTLPFQRETRHGGCGRGPWVMCGTPLAARQLLFPSWLGHLSQSRGPGGERTCRRRNRTTGLRPFRLIELGHQPREPAMVMQ